MKDFSEFPDRKYQVEVNITSEIPIGAGLGSSAAFSLALSSSLYFAL